jgi:hypothetical protein
VLIDRKGDDGAACVFLMWFKLGFRAMFRRAVFGGCRVDFRFEELLEARIISCS